MTGGRVDIVWVNEVALLLGRPLVFHPVPDLWWDRSAWRGEVEKVNSRTGPGGDFPGVDMPEAVASPCGKLAYVRVTQPPEERWGHRWGVSGRMASQGVHLALQHAEKVARPCARCYPGTGR